MQKKNDTTKSNNKWAKVWRMTSQTSFQASSITWNIWSGYKLETGSANWNWVWKHAKSGQFHYRLELKFDDIELISHLLKVKLIHFFSQGSTFSAIYFEKYPNRKSVNVKYKTNILQLSKKKRHETSTRERCAKI